MPMYLIFNPLSVSTVSPSITLFIFTVFSCTSIEETCVCSPLFWVSCVVLLSVSMSAVTPNPTNEDIASKIEINVIFLRFNSLIGNTEKSFGLIKPAINRTGERKRRR